jgi:amino acid adenylation domain-containing protein
MADQTGLYNLLYQAAEQYPHHSALIHNGTKFTYHDLRKHSEEINDILSRINIGKGDRVAICLTKSIEFVAAIFGVLKSGAAYLPLDYFSPDDRNIFIIENAGAKAIILKKDKIHFLSKDYLILAETNEGLIVAERKTQAKKSDTDLAYILYTSGSTGQPKGVMISSSAALEFINWGSETFRPTHNDKFASHAPFHFDLSVFDLFVSIKHAATLVLIDAEIGKQAMLLAKLIAEEKITIWYSTPAILHMIALYGRIRKYEYDHLRLVLFAGEVYPVNRFRKLKEQWPYPKYYNLYGPTETNVCTFYMIPDDPAEFPEEFPIGQKCAHYSAMVMKGEDDTSGELYISGKGLFSGYWGTEKENTWHMIDNKKWYNTGDIIQIDKNGLFVFKGRSDRMVKRNGYRIELAEIETSLAKNENIIECAVLCTTDESQTSRITAFVSCKKGEEESEIKMKEFCAKHLPSYMIPDTFIFLKRLPLTSNNKTDLQDLKRFL